MPSTNPSHRLRAFARQGGRCCYCTSPMWLNSPAELPCPTPSLRAAKHLQCTAEHLVARCDGGGNTADNIAAACSRCNQGRHKRRRPPGPSAFRDLVLRRMGTGQWHDQWVHEARKRLVDR
ncbi:HNH endonuclease [Rhizobacter sp. LjRoot28]|uniref:HNH endonuclease n=1 Tax=Rhizobacter sp. LjRoot28 TaxID=3342309 RepID=UPI003F4F9309